MFQHIMFKCVSYQSCDNKRVFLVRLHGWSRSPRPHSGLQNPSLLFSPQEVGLGLWCRKNLEMVQKHIWCHIIVQLLLGKTFIMKIQVSCLFVFCSIFFFVYFIYYDVNKKSRSRRILFLSQRFKHTNSNIHCTQGQT